MSTSTSVDTWVFLTVLSKEIIKKITIKKRAATFCSMPFLPKQSWARKGFLDLLRLFDCREALLLHSNYFCCAVFLHSKETLAYLHILFKWFFFSCRPQNVKRPLASGRGKTFLYLAKWFSSVMILAPGTVNVLWATATEWEICCISLIKCRILWLMQRHLEVWLSSIQHGEIKADPSFLEEMWALEGVGAGLNPELFFGRWFLCLAMPNHPYGLK